MYECWWDRGDVMIVYRVILIISMIISMIISIIMNMIMKVKLIFDESFMIFF